MDRKVLELTELEIALFQRNEAIRSRLDSEFQALFAEQYTNLEIKDLELSKMVSERLEIDPKDYAALINEGKLIHKSEIDLLMDKNHLPVVEEVNQEIGCQQVEVFEEINKSDEEGIEEPYSVETCRALNREGNPCRQKPLKDSEFCRYHK